MIKMIKKYFMRLEIKSLKSDLLKLEDMKSKLIYKPSLSEIPYKLEQCEKVEKQIKKTRKSILKLDKKYENLEQLVV